jgi:hypothetical protein
MLVEDCTRYQLVLVFLFSGPIHQCYLFGDRVVTSPSPQSLIYRYHLQELLEGLLEEVVFGGYACSTAVGEQVYVPPIYQRETG